MSTLIKKILNISGILVVLMAGMSWVTPVRAETPTSNFTAAPTSGETPLAVQFTDQSTGDPTGWAWYFGDEDLSASWTEVTASPVFTARHLPSSVVLPDGDIVLMGGNDGSRKNDVWRSADGGETWTQVTAIAEWSARSHHSSVVLRDGTIVLLGGYDGSNKNDVWRSNNKGENWTQVTASGPWWSARYGHTSVVLPDGDIVLMGGYDGSYKSDVWRSADGGETWTEVTPSGSWWSARFHHTSVVLPDGDILVMGGGAVGQKNDIWRSSDGGDTWIEVAVSGSWWSHRQVHTSVALPDGRIVLMGGYDGSYMSDVWLSSNGGASWQEVTASPGWSKRGSHTSVVLLDGTIVLLGGYDGSNQKNDVWRLETAGSNLQNPSHTFTETGTYSVTLQVYNNDGVGSTSKTDYINVEYVPVQADFTAVPTSGEPPLAVQFTDQSTGDPMGWAWYFGDEDFSEPWVQQTASAGWMARHSHTSVVLPDGSIVLLGGGYTLNDVWRSTDQGVTWVQQTASAEWPARLGHTSVVLQDGSILLMGGSGGSGSFNNDVWRSTDHGATWVQQTASAEWPARLGHTSVVLQDGSIVLMGGYDNNSRNDVWRSTDQGATWAKQTDSAEWSSRFRHTSNLLLDGSIIVMGGEDGSNKNDVWRSTDQGVTWTQMTSSAGWTARSAPTSVVLPNGDVLLMGGNDGSDKNDVWGSTNKGASWMLMTASAGWTARWGATSGVLSDGSILLMGGRGGTANKNDVWRLETAGSNLQNPSHTYTETGTYSVTLQSYNVNVVGRNNKADYIHVQYDPVQADFTATPTSGVVPLTVNFTNQTQGSYTTCSWVFGDGGTSNQCNPSHTFAEVGNYTVSLTASGPGGTDTETKAGYIQVTTESSVDYKNFLPLILH